MALKIRMRRVSSTSKKRYNFRIILIESTRPRDGRAIEELGYYDPSKKPASISIKKERIEYWAKKGAQLSPTVRSFLKRSK